MKYIDAEHLKAEIRRRIDWLNTATGDFAEGRRAEMRSLFDFINSLQEEQPIKSELKEEKIECSPVIEELIGKFFEVGHAYNFGFGPKDFLQEQPEVFDTVAFQKGVNEGKRLAIETIRSRIDEILGDAQPNPILRMELNELIKKIEE